MESPTKLRITFLSDGTVSLKADCNNAGGDYSVKGDQLNIKVGISTMALCPPESRSEQFLDLLGRAESYSITQGELKIGLASGGEMVFTSAPAEVVQRTASGAESRQNAEILTSGLLGRWEWVQFQSMDDTTLDISDPSRYTLEFRTDGVSLLADCNRGMGGFTLKGESLSFSEIGTTRMACPPDSLSDRCLNYLSYVRGWVMKDGNLYLSLFADGGIMQFRPAGESS